MSAHDITPNPRGAHPVFEALFEGMRAHGLLPNRQADADEQHDDDTTEARP